jgi:N-acetylmuramoyl-L-alanine amidase
MEAAVKDFQSKHGLTVNGIVGADTWEALSPCPRFAIKVLIDNGHGEETPGKRSPDGRLKEYAYTREIAKPAVKELQQRGIDALRIVTEETDVPLAERVARANNFYEANGKKAILVSVHCNAAGNGVEWMPARGWSIFVGGNASQKSRLLAWKMAEAALAKKVKVRQPSRQSLYWTADLYICRKTNYLTVLVENFFQDNQEDVAFLLSEEG